MTDTSAPFDILITDIRELVSADPAKAAPEDPLGRIADAAVGIIGDKIAYIGPQARLTDPMRTAARQRVSAHGAVVFPGLIDSHTHPVFAGTREDEFARRLKGVSYMQIASEGGGILRTVRETRAASEEALFARASMWLDEMLRWGTTTIEAKSGYGLSTESELKQLSVIGRLSESHAMEAVPTFMGAHEVPLEFRSRREAYVDLVVDDMLPAVAEQGIARFCDVFCEQGVFSIAESSRILRRASELGFGLRLHADEFEDSGGALLAAEIGAVSADHLMATSDDGMEAMRQSDVIATLLPATSFTLGLSRYARARAFLERGVRVALASDFNPGSCMCCNLGLVASLACTQLRMSFEEVLLAMTRHAAASLKLEDRVGCLAPGMQADLLLMDMPRPEYWIYHSGRNHVWKVMKRGVWVWEKPAPSVFLS